jgi:hypothetical protein
VATTKKYLDANFFTQILQRILMAEKVSRKFPGAGKWISPRQKIILTQIIRFFLTPLKRA